VLQCVNKNNEFARAVMAMHQINPQGAKLASLDPIWDRVRTEAEDIVRREPELASFIYSTVLLRASRPFGAVGRFDSPGL